MLVLLLVLSWFWMLIQGHSLDSDSWTDQGLLSDGLCRYGNGEECCWGWRRVDGGRCQPACQQGCKHGDCVGPDRCRCHPGYTGKACNQDLNECGVKPRPCKHRCMNTPGSYKCYCLDGHALQPDGSCRNVRTCYHANCQYGCEVMKGEVRCTCPSPGLRLGPDRRSCVDVDECSLGGAVCPRRRKCFNTFGSFFCKCHLGFKLTYINGRYACIDKDTRPFCSLNPSSPKCRCKDGRCKGILKVSLEPHRPRTTTTITSITSTTPTSTIPTTIPTTSTIPTSTSTTIPTTTSTTTSTTIPTTIPTITTTTIPTTSTIPTTTSTTISTTIPTTIPTTTTISTTISTTIPTTIPTTTTISTTISTTIPTTISTTIPTTLPATTTPPITTTSTTVSSTTYSTSVALTTTVIATTSTAPFTVATTTSTTPPATTATPAPPIVPATTVAPRVAGTTPTNAAEPTVAVATTGRPTPSLVTTTLNNRINKDVTQRQRGDVHIPRLPGHNHVWEFDIELGNTAEDARDDPEVGEVRCSFDHGLCDWISDREGDLHWEAVDGPAGGRYLSVPELKAGQGSIRGARLAIQTLPLWNQGDMCFSFSHWLTGHHLGVLQLFVRKKGRDQRYGPALWSRTGGHGWRRTQVTLQTHSVDKVLIKAERRNGRRGHIAVDDVTLRQGACR